MSLCSAVFKKKSSNCLVYYSEYIMYHDRFNNLIVDVAFL